MTWRKNVSDHGPDHPEQTIREIPQMLRAICLNAGTAKTEPLPHLRGPAAHGGRTTASHVYGAC